MENVKFGEFKVEDILTLTSTKSFDKGQLTFKDVGVAFVGRSHENNGIQGRVERLDVAPNEPYSITASVVGVKYALLQKEEYYCSQNINKLILINTDYRKNENVLFYITSAVQKVLNRWKDQYGGYLQSDLNSALLLLPMIDEDTPDWEYMDNYIKDVKAQRLKLIEDFVDKELTEIVEMKVLEAVEFGEFRLGEVISISSAKKPIHKNMVRDFNGSVPYVTRTESGNGVTEMINYDDNVVDHLNPGNVITLAMDTYVAFYQESEFFNGNKIKVAVPKHESYGKATCLFLTSAINKMFESMSWGMGIDAESLDALKINLPMIDSETPDWDFMDNHMKRIESEKKDLIRQFVENAGGGSID